MTLKSKLRKFNDDISKIDENNFEGEDADLFMKIQRERGLVNLAFFMKFKEE